MIFSQVLDFFFNISTYLPKNLQRRKGKGYHADAIVIPVLKIPTFKAFFKATFREIGTRFRKL